VLDGELTATGQLEPGAGQHLRIGAVLPVRVPAGRNAVRGAECLLPPVQKGCQRALPAGLAGPALPQAAWRWHG
jgi:hypothetical protein